MYGTGALRGSTHALAQGSPVTAFREFLAGAQSTEGRLALTLAAIGVTAILVGVVAPWIGRRVGRRFAWTDTDDGDDEGEPETSRVGVAVARSLQFVVLVTVAASLLVIWARFDDGLALLDQRGQSVQLLLRLVTTLGILVGAYVTKSVLDEAIARFSAGADRVTDHQEEIIRRLGQLGIIVLVIATTLTVWGVDLSGLLVGAGFLGIVVGLAARQTLGSLIAGFVLMFSRPFTIGDWIEVGDQEGIVTDITIVNTRLENFDGEFVVIPNDQVGNQPITNRSRKGHLRIRLDVGVDYASDPDHAREVALDAMRELDAIEQTPPPQAFLKSFGDSAVLIELRFWIDRPTPPRKWQARHAVVEAVKTAFDQEGIKIPFPQRELSGRAETGGFQTHSMVERRDGDGTGGPRAPAGSVRPGEDGGQATDGSTATSEDGSGREHDGETATEDDGDESGPEDDGETAPEGGAETAPQDDGGKREG